MCLIRHLISCGWVTDFTGTKLMFSVKRKLSFPCCGMICLECFFKASTDGSLRVQSQPASNHECPVRKTDSKD